MDKDIVASIVGDNESKSFGRVKPVLVILDEEVRCFGFSVTFTGTNRIQEPILLQIAIQGKNRTTNQSPHHFTDPVLISLIRRAIDRGPNCCAGAKPLAAARIDRMEKLVIFILK